MTRFGFHCALAGLAVFLAGAIGLPAATPNQAPDFREVYDLIRAHLSGVSDSELNRAAVQGLLRALGPNVSLVTNHEPANAPAATEPLSKATVFDGGIAYLRIADVQQDLPRALESDYQALASTNKLRGVVLDLRYADGEDYAAAAAAADLFVGKPQPLLDWGKGMVSSRENTNAISLPVAVLVNEKTAQAAEALAAVLREVGAGLILGSRTEGRAMITQDFPLKNGERLRIASTPIALGDGSKLSTDGVKPDIEVQVSPKDERAYYANAYLVLTRTNLLASSGPSASNQPQAASPATHQVRLNEAELVREHKEGLDQGGEGEVTLAGPPEPEKPVVSDPALARALDLLKGLAVVRRDRF